MEYQSEEFFLAIMNNNKSLIDTMTNILTPAVHAWAGDVSTSTDNTK